MIKNDKQLTITKNKLIEFKTALAHVQNEIFANPIIKKAQIDALQSQIEVFEKDIFDYENLKSGNVLSIKVCSIDGLPDAIIKTRIARGLSQAALANKLGVAEQQVQRDEANNYSSASISKLSEIIELLELNFSGSFDEVIVPTFEFTPLIIEQAKLAEEKVRYSKSLLLV
jgi:transcriptional regulator with XRE-family HTH domain